MSSIAGEISKEKDVSSSFISNGTYFNKYSTVVKRQHIQKNDILVGKVHMIRQKNIIIRLDHNITADVPVNCSGVLSVQKVNSSFIVSLVSSPLFKAGDIVLVDAREVTSGDIVVSTDRDDLGVVLSKCSFCNKLISEYSGVNCPNCNYVNLRKYSSKYGSFPKL